MRKLIVVFLIILAFPMASLALSPGNYVTLQNLNVRSSMLVTNNLINNIKKGNVVNVASVHGNWCGINYKNYRRAYIYCTRATVANVDGILEIKPAPVSDVYGFSAANDVLENLNHWLMDNKEFGRKYINSSEATGWTAALEWQKEAGPTLFIFDYPFRTDAKCTFSFVSPSDPNKIYKYNCSETGKPGAEGVLMDNVAGNTDIKIPDSFKVPMAAVVARMIDGNGKIWPMLKTYFAGSKSINLEFTLSAKKEGTNWYVKFTDEKGKSLKLKVDGTDKAAEFIVNP